MTRVRALTHDVNWLRQAYSGARSDLAGHIGIEFTTTASFAVGALGRGLWNATAGARLLQSALVTLWKVTGWRSGDVVEIAASNVGPESDVAEGYAREPLHSINAAPSAQCPNITSGCVWLTSGQRYRVTMLASVGMPDTWYEGPLGNGVAAAYATYTAKVHKPTTGTWVLTNASGSSAVVDNSYFGRALGLQNTQTADRIE